MAKLDFKPRGVCARMIHVELSDDGQTVESVSFEGGCNGNLKAISKLVAGQPVDHIVEMLEGNTCGPRKTSCADQMTRALREAQGQIAEWKRQVMSRESMGDGASSRPPARRRRDSSTASYARKPI